MKKCPLVRKAKIAYKVLDEDYEKRQRRTDSLCEKMEREVRKDKNERGCFNWFNIVGYRSAHCGGDFKSKKIDPCPFCLGKEGIVFFDKDSPATGYKNMGDCPVCKGEGTAWLKYGLFEIEEDTHGA